MIRNYLTTVDYEQQVYPPFEDTRRRPDKDTSPIQAALLDRTGSCATPCDRSSSSKTDLAFITSTSRPLRRKRFKSAGRRPFLRRCSNSLALMDAGIRFRQSPGPSPVGGAGRGQRLPISSTRLVEPFALPVDHVVAGHLSEPPSPEPVAAHQEAVEPGADPTSPLRRRRGGQHRTDERLASGRPPCRQSRIGLGVRVTHRGVRYFTSMYRPRRAGPRFVDAEACAEQILDFGSAQRHPPTSDLYGTLLSSG